MRKNMCMIASMSKLNVANVTGVSICTLQYSMMFSLCNFNFFGMTLSTFVFHFADCRNSIYLKQTHCKKLENTTQIDYLTMIFHSLMELWNARNTNLHDLAVSSQEWGFHANFLSNCFFGKEIHKVIRKRLTFFCLHTLANPEGKRRNQNNWKQKMNFQNWLLTIWDLAPAQHGDAASTWESPWSHNLRWKGGLGGGRSLIQTGSLFIKKTNKILKIECP